MGNYGFKNNGINVKSLKGSIQSLSGAGAINTIDLITEITSTGTDALTLANGDKAGQIKIIKGISLSAGDATLTPTNLLDGTDLTFDNTDYAILYWTGSTWTVLLYNAALA